MKKLAIRIKNAFDLFFYSLRTGQSLNDIKLSFFTDAFSTMNDSLDNTKFLDEVQRRSSSEFSKILNDWIMEKLAGVFPKEIINLYLEDGKKVPGLDLSVHKNPDIKTRTIFYEAWLSLHGKPLGHVTITNHPESIAGGTFEVRDFDVPRV